MKNKIFLGTTNKGKQSEIEKFAYDYFDKIEMIFPIEPIKADENGRTFQENALIKAKAYKNEVNNPEYIYVGDDSGIKIPALNDEPGVDTHVWAGYEMKDEEILEYCIEKMKDFHGDERKAVFETTLAVIMQDGEIKYFKGQMWGHLLEKPIDATPIEGFPFRSIFWVDQLDCPIYDIHRKAPLERKGFLTHRELAFKSLFDYLSIEN